jgi:hypothetical protein
MGFRFPAQLRVLAVVLFVLLFGLSQASAQRLPSDKLAPQGQSTGSGGGGRLYLFRMVRSFDAHIDDYVTINGVPIRRVSPGSGFYCDISPGDYVIGVWRHKNQPLNVSVAPGQRQYVCVMLHHVGDVAPRDGALTFDQAFDIRLLDPGYGAERVQQYRMTEANCQQQK